MRLGRYELVVPLGHGGMGEVWLARLTGAAGFEKPCIVKTVLPQLQHDGVYAHRFMHEAKVLVHLTHSNIAQVFDMGEADGKLYMALELVLGVDLSRLTGAAAVANERVPQPIALYLASQAAEGLAYAHRCTAPDGAPLGVVHRDVSPHNVMVSYEGEVKVIDFGIAKSAAQTSATGVARVMGKLGYMAPEQARGEPVDARADQYALGVVTWELLAGRPFVLPGTIPEMVAAMAHPVPPPLTGVDAAVDAVVQRALAVHRDDRWPSCDDFARELARLGPLPSKAEVGAYVRAKCADELAEQSQRLSDLALGKTLPSTSPSRTMPYDLQPIAPVAPVAPIAAARSPRIGTAAVSLALVLGGAAFLLWPGRTQEPVVTPLPPSSHAAPALAAVEVVDAGPLAAPRKMSGRLRLQVEPHWSITLTNTSDFAWSACRVVVPGQRRFDLKGLGAGASRELSMETAAIDLAAKQLEDEVAVRCSEGALTLPVRQ